MAKKKKTTNRDLRREFSEQYQSTVRKSRIKTCLHPNKEECSNNIIKAHSIKNNSIKNNSIKNNRILSKLSKSGNVIMPIPKSDTPLDLMTEYGRKNRRPLREFVVLMESILQKELHLTLLMRYYYISFLAPIMVSKEANFVV